MLQKEFEQRTGISLTEKEYALVDRMYNEAGDINKDQFCADWKKHKDSILLKEFCTQSRFYQSQVKSLNEKVKDLAIFMVDQAEKCSSTDLRNKAIQMLGLSTYLRIKLEKGYNIWEIDRQDMINLLLECK